MGDVPLEYKPNGESNINGPNLLKTTSFDGCGMGIVSVTPISIFTHQSVDRSRYTRIYYALHDHPDFSPVFA